VLYNPVDFKDDEMPTCNLQPNPQLLTELLSGNHVGLLVE